MKKLQYFIAPVLVFVFLFAPVVFLQAEAGWDLSTVSGFGLPSGRITDIATGILEWLLTLIGIIAIIGFIISGAMYILSAGDDKGAEKAKVAMKNSIIGVIVALAGYVVIKAVESMLNAGYDY